MMNNNLKEIDEKTYYSILFAYYQNLLTDKQKNIFISYYDKDYSLAEIAEDLNVSRSAVWDSLKVTCKSLEDFESKLCCYYKDTKIHELLLELTHVNNNNDLDINQKKENINTIIKKLELLHKKYINVCINKIIPN